MKKIIGGLLSFILFFTQALFAHAIETNLWKERRENVQLARLNLPSPQAITPPPSGRKIMPLHTVQDFSSRRGYSEPTTLPAILAALSSQYGSIRKVSHKGERIVIHIQDVHMNAEAQSNMAKTITELMGHNHVDLIALEGAFQPIPLEGFRKYPHKEITHDVADYLLQANKISGPVYAALTSDAKLPPVVGIDDKTHYDANVQAYKDSVSLAPALKKEWTNDANDIAAKKALTLNPYLKAFDDNIQAYTRGELSLAAYLQTLASHVNATPTAFDIFLELLDMESKLDFAKVERERTELIESLVARLKGKEVSNLVNQTVAYRMGQMSHADFYNSLNALCDQNGIDLRRTPAMQDYIQYVLLSDSVDIEAVMSTARSLEIKAYAALARTDEERELIKASRALYLIGKLLDFALTPEEWEEYQHLQSVSPSPLVSQSPRHIDKETWRQGERGKQLESFELFYEEAEARDGALAGNLVKAMDDHNAKVAVLVTGGFHAQGIKDVIANLPAVAGGAQQSNDITYVSYVPRISKVDSDQGSSYLSVFTQEKTPLEKLFQGEKLFLAHNPADVMLASMLMLGAHEVREPGDVAPAVDTALLHSLTQRQDLAGEAKDEGKNGFEVTSYNKEGEGVRLSGTYANGRFTNINERLKRGWRTKRRGTSKIGLIAVMAVAFIGIAGLMTLGAFLFDMGPFKKVAVAPQPAVVQPADKEETKKELTAKPESRAPPKPLDIEVPVPAQPVQPEPEVKPETVIPVEPKEEPKVEAPAPKPMPQPMPKPMEEAPVEEKPAPKATLPEIQPETEQPQEEPAKPRVVRPGAPGKSVTVQGVEIEPSVQVLKVTNKDGSVEYLSGTPGMAYQPIPDNMTVDSVNRSGDWAGIYGALLPPGAKGVDTKKYPNLAALANRIGARAKGDAADLEAHGVKIIRTYNLVSEKDKALLDELFTWANEAHQLKVTVGMYDPTEEEAVELVQAFGKSPWLLTFDGWNEINHANRGGITAATYERIDRIAGVMKAVAPDDNDAIMIVIARPVTALDLKAIKAMKNIDLVGVTFYGSGGQDIANALKGLQKQLAPKTVVIAEIGVDERDRARAGKFGDIFRHFYPTKPGEIKPTAFVLQFYWQREKWKGDDQFWAIGGTPIAKIFRAAANNWRSLSEAEVTAAQKAAAKTNEPTEKPEKTTPAGPTVSILLNDFYEGVDYYGVYKKGIEAEQSQAILAHQTLRVRVGLAPAAIQGFHFEIKGVGETQIYSLFFKKQGEKWVAYHKGGKAVAYAAVAEGTREVTASISLAEIKKEIKAAGADAVIEQIHFQTGAQQDGERLNPANVRSEGRVAVVAISEGEKSTPPQQSKPATDPKQGAKTQDKKPELVVADEVAAKDISDQYGGGTESFYGRYGLFDMEESKKILAQQYIVVEITPDDITKLTGFRVELKKDADNPLGAVFAFKRGTNWVFTSDSGQAITDRRFAVQINEGVIKAYIPSQYIKAAGVASFGEFHVQSGKVHDNLKKKTVTLNPAGNQSINAKVGGATFKAAPKAQPQGKKTGATKFSAGGETLVSVPRHESSARTPSAYASNQSSIISNQSSNIAMTDDRLDMTDGRLTPIAKITAAFSFLAIGLGAGGGSINDLPLQWIIIPFVVIVLGGVLLVAGYLYAIRKRSDFALANNIVGVVQQTNENRVVVVGADDFGRDHEIVLQLFKVRNNPSKIAVLTAGAWAKQGLRVKDAPRKKSVGVITDKFQKLMDAFQQGLGSLKELPDVRQQLDDAKKSGVLNPKAVLAAAGVVEFEEYQKHPALIALNESVPGLAFPDKAVAAFDERKKNSTGFGPSNINVGDEKVYIFSHVYFLDVVVKDLQRQIRVVPTYRNAPVVHNGAQLLGVGPETLKIWGALVADAGGVLQIGETPSVRLPKNSDRVEGSLRDQLDDLAKKNVVAKSEEGEFVVYTLILPENTIDARSPRSRAILKAVVTKAFFGMIGVGALAGLGAGGGNVWSVLVGIGVLVAGIGLGAWLAKRWRVSSPRAPLDKTLADKILAGLESDNPTEYKKAKKLARRYTARLDRIKGALLDLENVPFERTEQEQVFIDTFKKLGLWSKIGRGEIKNLHEKFKREWINEHTSFEEYVGAFNEEYMAPKGIDALSVADFAGLFGIWIFHSQENIATTKFVFNELKTGEWRAKVKRFIKDHETHSGNLLWRDIGIAAVFSLIIGGFGGWTGLVGAVAGLAVAVLIHQVVFGILVWLRTGTRPVLAVSSDTVGFDPYDKSPLELREVVLPLLTVFLAPIVFLLPVGLAAQASVVAAFVLFALANLLHGEGWILGKKIRGLLFWPTIKFTRVGQPFDPSIIQKILKRSATEVIDMVAAAGKRGIKLIIKGLFRGIDGPGSSLDLPIFQLALTSLRARKLNKITSTLAIATEMGLTFEVGLAEDPEAIEYVADEYGYPASNPMVIRDVKTLLDENGKTYSKYAVPYVFMHLFGLKGIRITLKDVDPLATAGGMESSNVFFTGAIAAANILSDAGLSKADIFGLAVKLENDVFYNGNTGGQGHLASLVGRAFQHVWLSGFKGRYGVFSISRMNDAQLDALQKNIFLVQAGIDYEDGKKVIPRLASLTNDMWTDLLKDGDAVASVHYTRQLELAAEYSRALERGDYEAIADFWNEYVDIRDKVTKRWFTVMFGVRDGTIKPGDPEYPYASKYKDRVYNPASPFYGLQDSITIRELIEKHGNDLATTLSLYCYGLKKDPLMLQRLIVEARADGIALFPLGAGGPSALLAAVPKPGENNDGAARLEALMIRHGMKIFGDRKEITRVITGTGHLKGYLPFKAGKEPMTFEGFEEAGFTLPEDPSDAVFNEAKGQLVVIGKSGLLNKSSRATKQLWSYGAWNIRVRVIPALMGLLILPGCSSVVLNHDGFAAILLLAIIAIGIAAPFVATRRFGNKNKNNNGKPKFPKSRLPMLFLVAGALLLLPGCSSVEVERGNGIAILGLLGVMALAAAIMNSGQSNPEPLPDDVLDDETVKELQGNADQRAAVVSQMTENIPLIWDGTNRSTWERAERLRFILGQNKEVYITREGHVYELKKDYEITSHMAVIIRKGAYIEDGLQIYVAEGRQVFIDGGNVGENGAVIIADKRNVHIRNSIEANIGGGAILRDVQARLTVERGFVDYVTGTEDVTLMSYKGGVLRNMRLLPSKEGGHYVANLEGRLENVDVTSSNGLIVQTASKSVVKGTRLAGKEGYSVLLETDVNDGGKNPQFVNLTDERARPQDPVVIDHHTGSDPITITDENINQIGTRAYILNRAVPLVLAAVTLSIFPGWEFVSIKQIFGVFLALLILATLMFTVLNVISFFQSKDDEKPTAKRTSPADIKPTFIVESDLQAGGLNLKLQKQDLYIDRAGRVFIKALDGNLYQEAYGGRIETLNKNQIAVIIHKGVTLHNGARFFVNPQWKIELNLKEFGLAGATIRADKQDVFAGPKGDSPRGKASGGSVLQDIDGITVEADFAQVRNIRGEGTIIAKPGSLVQDSVIIPSSRSDQRIVLEENATARHLNFATHWRRPITVSADAQINGVRTQMGNPSLTVTSVISIPERAVFTDKRRNPIEPKYLTEADFKLGGSSIRKAVSILIAAVGISLYSAAASASVIASLPVAVGGNPVINLDPRLRHSGMTAEIALADSVARTFTEALAKRAEPLDLQSQKQVAGTINEILATRPSHLGALEADGNTSFGLNSTERSNFDVVKFRTALAERLKALKTSGVSKALLMGAALDTVADGRKVKQLKAMIGNIPDSHLTTIALNDVSGDEANMIWGLSLIDAFSEYPNKKALFVTPSGTLGEALREHAALNAPNVHIEVDVNGALFRGTEFDLVALYRLLQAKGYLESATGFQLLYRGITELLGKDDPLIQAFARNLIEKSLDDADAVVEQGGVNGTVLNALFALIGA